MKPSHLGVDELRITSIPTIADEQNHRTASQNPSGPLQIELSERGSDASTSGPVDDGIRHGGESLVWPPLPKHGAQTRESSTEDKALDTVPEAMGQAV